MIREGVMKEDEIRKRDIFNQYLKLVEIDVSGLFDFSSFLKISCPACAGTETVDEFSKSGFIYVSCRNCTTLFVNPRPLFKTLRDFYNHSTSSAFWVNKFFKPVAEARREKIFGPRAKYISTILDSQKKYFVGDIGAGFGLFLEELRKIQPINRYVAIEPSHEMADICREKKFEIKDFCLEEIEGMDGKFDLLTAFELTEHLVDPAMFMEKVYKLLKPGGIFFLTTLNAKGFDILLLWEKSKSIMPPHHLNFFNTKSIQYLLERIGFDIVEVSTPGQLDWDIVEGMIKNEDIFLGRWWKMVADDLGPEGKAELQDWLTKYNLSSHMRVIVKKPLVRIKKGHYETKVKK